jgi:hypothetical protein
VRFALPILVAALVAAWAGYRVSKLSTVTRLLPWWYWRIFWTLIAAVLLMVPVLWWLDF